MIYHDHRCLLYMYIYFYSVLYARYIYIYIYGERTWRKVPLFERFRVRGLPEQCKECPQESRSGAHLCGRIF